MHCMRIWPAPWMQSAPSMTPAKWSKRDQWHSHPLSACRSLQPRWRNNSFSLMYAMLPRVFNVVWLKEVGPFEHKMRNELNVLWSYLLLWRNSRCVSNDGAQYLQQQLCQSLNYWYDSWAWRQTWRWWAWMSWVSLWSHCWLHPGGRHDHFCHETAYVVIPFFHHWIRKVEQRWSWICEWETIFSNIQLLFEPRECDPPPKLKNELCSKKLIPPFLKDPAEKITSLTKCK